MKPSVIIFPASNCDRDVAVALEQAAGNKPQMVWHGDASLPDTDFIVLPGGFSYGETDELGSQPVTEPTHVRRLHATILHLLGLEPNNLTYFYGGLNHRLVGVEGADPIWDVIA